MPSYTAPIKDMQFVLHNVLNVTESSIPGYEELEADFTSAILEEAGKLTSEVLAPLNAVGDKEGCRLVTPRKVSRKPSPRSRKAAGPVWTCPSNMAGRTCLISSVLR